MYTYSLRIMSHGHLADFVGVRISEDVGTDRSRARNGYADVVLKQFGCKTVEIALSVNTALFCHHHHYHYIVIN